MIKEDLKKLFAVILCMSLLILQYHCEKVLANDHVVLDEYEQINKKIVDLYSSGEEPSEIFLGLSSDEAQILSSHYAGLSAASIFSKEVLENDEIKYIDALAAEYYDILEENGQLEKLSDMSISESNQLFDSIELSETFIDQSCLSKTRTSMDYSVIMQSLGYSFTFDQIARQLVLIGSAISFSAALPFIELLAVVVGTLIATLAIAVLYCAVADTANELIGSWYLYHTKQIRESSQVTAAVVAQYQNGARYWQAHRANWGGMGGILIEQAIKMEVAVGYVVADRPEEIFPEVFCMKLNDAQLLVQRVGTDYGLVFSGIASPVQVHRENKKYLNMQHIHAMLKNGRQGNTHIFFAGY